MSTNPLRQDLEHILDHTSALWEELKGGRIFITGGTGFFGCWLLESFLWANERLALGAEAHVLTRNLEAFRQKAPHLAGNSAIQWHTGDITNFTFPQGKFSHVIHAATQASAKLVEEDPLRMFDTVVEGTRHALDFACACGAKKFLLTSSGSVYGRTPPELTHIPESYVGGPDPSVPSSAYGEGKRASELLCALYAKHHGLETKMARGFAFVGPYLPLDIHFAIGNFIGDALKGGPIQISGDGTPHRSYLYSADLVIWLWTILFRGVSCRPYNIGSEQSQSLGDVARAVDSVFEGKPTVRIAQQPVPGKAPLRYVPDTTRARTELGLAQWISIEEGIRRTRDFHRLGL